MFNLTPAAKNILIINGVIFIITSGYVIEEFGLRYILSNEFKPYQFLTYMWIHAGFGHIFSNMFAVLVFAPILEKVWGSRKFFIYYLITGVGAGILYSGVNFIENLTLENKVTTYTSQPSPEAFRNLILNESKEYYNQLYDFINSYSENPNSSQYKDESISIARSIFESKSNIPMVGASGAVFGILLAFAMLFPNMELYMLFFPFPIKAKYLVLGYGLYEIWSEFNRMPGDNVAHLAHLGGMLIGYIILRYWKNKYGTYY
ncbi:MAG: rhomboid family intramembrane serine protease [Cytophagales bacterium]|nr:rhomboid family intramembrane serine protease [Flammeovirgaceae bacterium]PDH45880.1 MAG: rhomboid family intramembrane serine protease [Rhodothermaeota bacterium MED-G18]|tara:strand:- start:2834 stop:3613 length:780 start_codon:yes stop_codon:yes gene_type:complete